MKNLALISLFAVAAAANANIITNGTFEANSYPQGSYISINSGNAASNLNGWTVEGTEVAGIGKNYLGAPSQEIDLSGSYDQSRSGIKQSFASTAGQKYLVSFDIFTGDLYGYDSGVDFIVNGNTLGNNLKSSVSSDARKTMSYTITADSASTEVKFLRNHGLVTHVDNVNVQAVPEPMTMITLGAGALAMLRRRRSAK